MGKKTLPVWTLLAALVGIPALAQDDSGWEKRTGPRALPPADPDEGLEILIPAAPAAPPMPPVPPVPPIPTGPDDLPAPRVVQVTAVPPDAPVAEMLAPPWLGLSAGAGFSVLRPYVNNNPAYTVVNPQVGGRTVSFDWNPETAVHVWLAYDDPSGLGARVRAFVFDAESPILGVGLTGAGALPTVTT
ncbi:MAG: hypothetical protein J2P46_18945, partial [Zavarzinella sp.]|nr:hypothetical protein [Zavarzinella sp.]